MRLSLPVLIRNVVSLAALGSLGVPTPTPAAPPVCPMPTQGYEIAGCFVDDNGDEFLGGGSVDVYDLAFDQSLNASFPQGTFVVDGFLVTAPATPPLDVPADCGVCGPVDFCVVVTFGSTPAGTPTPQALCADGDATVNDGGFEFGSRVATLPPTAELSVTKTDNVEIFDPGETLNYVITVSNAGPADVTGVRVLDQPPPELVGASWTCAAGSGALCPSSGTGPIDEFIDLAAGSSVIFTLTAATASDFEGVIVNEVDIFTPEGVVDPEPSNNSAFDRSASASLFRDGFESVIVE